MREFSSSSGTWLRGRSLAQKYLLTCRSPRTLIASGFHGSVLEIMVSHAVSPLVSNDTSGPALRPIA
jgi:hypothetical protein